MDYIILSGKQDIVSHRVLHKYNTYFNSVDFGHREERIAEERILLCALEKIEK